MASIDIGSTSNDGVTSLQVVHVTENDDSFATDQKEKQDKPKVEEELKNRKHDFSKDQEMKKKRRSAKTKICVQVSTPNKGILKPVPIPKPSSAGRTGLKRQRSLNDLIESPALFDREYVRKATKDELLIACGPTGLLPAGKRNRTCKNLRSALESTRAEIVKNLDLNNPILLLKNMGKHTFYRVSVCEAETNESPGGGEFDPKKKIHTKMRVGGCRHEKIIQVFK